LIVQIPQTLPSSWFRAAPMSNKHFYCKTNSNLQANQPIKAVNMATWYPCLLACLVCDYASSCWFFRYTRCSTSNMADCHSCTDLRHGWLLLYVSCNHPVVQPSSHQVELAMQQSRSAFWKNADVLICWLTKTPDTLLAHQKSKCHACGWFHHGRCCTNNVKAAPPTTTSSATTSKAACWYNNRFLPNLTANANVVIISLFWIGRSKPCLAC